MNRSVLEELGFSVREVDGALEVDLTLSGGLINPLTRKLIRQATFAVLGDRLLAVSPPELVGSPPILLARIEGAEAIEQHLGQALNEHILQVSRRSSELAALGISPIVDPPSLGLSAKLKSGAYELELGSDRRGNFRLSRATKDGRELEITAPHSFELSEFRDRSALEGYLLALLGEPASTAPAKSPARPQEAPLRYGEVAKCFGLAATVPARSPVEILIDIRVGDEAYRFAAARVAGRTFRGLLAGSAGKVWSERFDLDQFPGVKTLVSNLLSVTPDEVLLSGEEE